MHRLNCLLPLLALIAFGSLVGSALPQHIAPTPHLPPPEEAARFRLPPGFVAQLVAAEPKIKKPINLAFDARGRLWVTCTEEYPFPAPAGRDPRDQIVILSDFAPTGEARRVEVFADKLNIPIGIAPLPDARSALAFSIPSIWELRDTDNSGTADQRQVRYSRFGYNDTHGMVNALCMGFDGWIYACHGFANHSTVKGSDQREHRMYSGNTFRFKRDGSHVQGYTYGQVNPFGMTLDPLGFLYTADCHSKPITQLIPGAYYSSGGRPHDGLGFGPHATPHDHGSTALCGLSYYDADHFPPGYRGRLFLGNVVTNRINSDLLQWEGATPHAREQPDFLVSHDPWFRPVDIQLGPDGALYVADFYNRIIGHYEVPLDHAGRDRTSGRIWRIVYRGLDGNAPPPSMPRADWTTATPEELVADLSYANLTVRLIATHQLVERGRGVAAAVRVALGGQSAHARAHAAWVLERLGVLTEAELGQLLADPQMLVRVHALRILAHRERLTEQQRATVHRLLRQDEPIVQRVAAEVLYRAPELAHLRPLLDARHATPAQDTHRLHMIRIALREQLRQPEAWELLGQGPAAGCDAPKLPLTQADSAALADVAVGVPTEQSARFLMRHLRQHGDTLENVQRFVKHIARYGSDADNADLLAWARDYQPNSLPTQLQLVIVIHKGRQERGTPPSQPTTAYIAAIVGKCLQSDNPGLLQPSIELVGALRLQQYQAELTKLATDRQKPQNLRFAAVSALSVLDREAAVPIVANWLHDQAQPREVRMQAAATLGTINTPSARGELTKALVNAPASTAGTIALHLASSPEGADQLLQLVQAGKASARLLQDRTLSVRLTDSKLPGVAERIRRLTVGLPSADQAMRTLLEQRRQQFDQANADPTRGAKVFTQHCAICHQLAGQGAKIGPQLDGIGNRGLERLLEDILDPSRNVDEAFRTTHLVLKSGRTLAGLLVREQGATLTLADAQGKEIAIALDDVEERYVSPISPMPANFAQQVSEADFRDLLAYLLQQRVNR